jgi:histidine triad (HIT) family protein
MREASGETCLICRLVHGELPSSRVHEDEHVVAFMDLHPVNPGHLFVVPRAHVPLLDDLDDDLSIQVYRVAHRLTRALRRSGLRCEGVNLFLADGPAAFQEVPHVHLHVFPRFVGDSFRIDADWRARSRDELDAAAKKIRDADEPPMQEHRGSRSTLGRAGPAVSIDREN